MRDNAAISDDDAPSLASAAARAAERARDAQWVRDAVAGDRDAFGRLYEAWFDRVFHLAARIVHDREIAGEVCQDAFLAAWRNLGGLQDPTAFGGWLLRIARNAAYNRSEREARSRPVDDRGLAVIEEAGASPSSAPTGFDVASRLGRTDDPELAAGDSEVAALVREAVDALSDRDGQVLDLQLRFNLTPAEIGEVMGVNRNAANQLCHRVRQRFATAFRARILWAGSGPACPELASALRSAGVAGYGTSAVPVAERHLSSCERCQERSELRLQPAALFAAIPLLAAPAPLKEAVAGQLVAHGVPMGAAGPGAGGPPPHSTEGDPVPRGSTDEAALDGADPAGWAPSTTAGPPLPPPPPPPPPPPEVAAAAATGATARRWLAAAAAVVVLALVGAVVISLGDREPSLVAADDTTTSTTDVPASSETSASTTAPPGAPSPPSTGEPGPPATSTTSPTTGPTTTSTVAPPVIQLFELWNGEAQPAGYTLGPDSPLLRWTVSDATNVEVWAWYEGGGAGPQEWALLSTDPSGELTVCPGTELDATCITPVGRYTFVLEATNGAHTVTSDQANPPGFEVYPVIT